jgi:hypothetical protein
MKTYVGKSFSGVFKIMWEEVKLIDEGSFTYKRMVGYEVRDYNGDHVGEIEREFVDALIMDNDMVIVETGKPIEYIKRLCIK